jgi:four helix bundle protein
MKKDNVVRDKSYAFALKIIKASQLLRGGKREYVLSRQLLRSGTAIGANIEEALGAQIRKDFYAKLTIAYKESRETKYWIRLLRDSNYLSIEDAELLLIDIEELLRLIGSIQRTIKNSST